MLVLGQSGFHLSVDSNPLWFWCSFTMLIVIGLEKQEGGGVGWLAQLSNQKEDDN